MRCLTYAIKQLTEHGGYISIRPSFRDDGNINPWIFHVLWSEDIAGVRHLTTDDHKRHWFKEFLCCLTGQHYVKSTDDSGYAFKQKGMPSDEIPLFLTLISLVALIAIMLCQAFFGHTFSKLRIGARKLMKRRSWISFLMVVVVMVVGLSGCSAIFGEGDYGQYSQALQTHSNAEGTRIAAQATAIADASKVGGTTPTESALLATIAMMQIERLQPVPLGIAKPTTGMDVALAGVNQIPFVAGMSGAAFIAKEGIRAAGNVTIGENSPVSGSFNKPTAINIGGQNSVTSAAPTVETVKPEIVYPEVVK